jgi:hypothetical protein
VFAAALASSATSREACCDQLRWRFSRRQLLLYRRRPLLSRSRRVLFELPLLYRSQPLLNRKTVPAAVSVSKRF